MADVKNYSIKINTEVTGEEEITKLGNEVETTATKFTRLQRQIRDTKTALQEAEATGDSVRFNKLKKQLDELEDGFEINRMKSQQLDDQLQSMPGTLGSVGGAIKQVDGVFKMLGANPIIAVMLVAAGAFITVKKALESTKEGQEALSKVTDAFGKIITPIVNFISSSAVPIIEMFANGINSLAVALGLASKNEMEAIDIEKEKSKSIRDLHKDYSQYLQLIRDYDNKIKEVNKNERLNIDQKQEWINLLEKEKKSVVANFNEVSKIIKEKSEKEAESLKESLKISASSSDARTREINQLKATYNEQKLILQGGITDKKEKNEALKNLDIKYHNDLKELNNKYNKEAADKRKAANEKHLAEQKAANEVLFQAQLIFLNDQQKELLSAEKKYQQDILILKKAGFKEGSKEMLYLQTSYNQEVIDINAKYAKQSQDEIQKIYDKQKEDIQKQIDYYKGLNLDNETYWMEHFQKISDNQNLSFEDRYAAIDEATEREVELFKKNNNVNEKNEVFYQNRINDIRKKGVEKRKALNKEEREVEFQKYQSYGQMASGFGSIMQDIAEMGDQSLQKTKGLAIAGVVVEKAGAIASIVANTLKNASKFGYLSPLGIAEMVAGAAGVTSTILQSVKAIQNINSASKNSGDSGGNETAVLPTFSAAPVVNAPTVQVSQQNTVGQDVAQSINNAPTSPQKVYVVSQEITSNQQLDRRTKENATF